MKLPVDFQYAALIGKTLQELERPDPDREGVRVSLLEILADAEDNTNLEKRHKPRIRKFVRKAIDELEQARDRGPVATLEGK